MTFIWHFYTSHFFGLKYDASWIINLDKKLIAEVENLYFYLQ